MKTFTDIRKRFVLSDDSIHKELPQSWDIFHYYLLRYDYIGKQCFKEGCRTSPITSLVSKYFQKSAWGTRKNMKKPCEEYCWANFTVENLRNDCSSPFLVISLVAEDCSLSLARCYNQNKQSNKKLYIFCGGNNVIFVVDHYPLLQQGAFSSSGKYFAGLWLYIAL